ncbi:cadherin-like beta sandwich domain-containing protein [Cohnella hashimotonis]|uniref:Cadherin-like beta sandwich domain-containing protein n=1 Tax=Cohnella hashimotonis TaxID=2826895 RepID=A0ABT6TTS6_9BACL|nr:cadherin-like beta sandwich domain-containing protein [Cohnella hashimotonis]MDI4650267.1 cadherin-like beta sandwich domain-containing protein [Cohnella hashimotonis]
MYRKLSMYLLAALLLLLPVSAAFGGEAHAASSSRIAVIKQLSGDVQVQKAGGSKLFKAFAKLSLNQGDKLITGSKGSAVLQFSNGTSEDDKFTVGENATLTFSKLSDKKGTVTKVSMLKGTAWVDVKSIKSQDDDFKLETPTAIMGVRGTAFLARVNPETGGTNTSVMSGVVRFTSENAEKTGSESGESSGKTGSSGGSKTIDLYPTQQLSLDPTSGTDLGELTTLVDIEEIVKNASPALIEAILRSKEKIDEENRQTVEKFKQSGVPAGLQQQLEQFIQNTQELLGVIAKQAIDQKKMDEQQIKKIEEQEKTSFGLDKDQLSQLSDKEKAKQEKAKQLAEEAAKKKAAEEAAKLKELADKINAAALKAIEAAKQAQIEANRLAAEAAKRKAEEELLKKLNEQQKQQYETDKANNNGTGPAATPTPISNDPANANLGSLSLSGATISPSFDAGVMSYTASVESSRTSIVVGASVQSGTASLTINGQTPNGGQRTVNLAYGANEITILVTAQNGASKSYKVTVTRQMLNNVSVVFPGAEGINIDFNSTTAPAPLSIPSGTSNLTLVVPVTGPELDIAVNGQNVEPEPMFTAARTVLPDQIAWRYNIPLAQQTNEIVIQATIDGVVMSYKLTAVRSMTNETAVQSVTATGTDGTTAYEVVSGSGGWTVKVPSDTSAIKLKINTINATAKVLLGTNEYASGAEIPYTIVNTSVPFTVRAADGATQKMYAITIQRLPSSNATLSGLTLSAGTLSPTFASGTTNYTASVGNAVTSIAVTPTAANGAATIKVNDAAVTSGSASAGIPLSAGSNQITVEVTAQNGDKQKYTIMVTRENSALATPTFNPPSGAVAFGTPVTISSDGAEHIYYTTDGSTPATGVTGATKEYSASSKPTIDAAGTIKAIATRAGYPNSPVGSASYTQAASADLTELALSGSVSGFSFVKTTYNYADVLASSDTSSLTVNAQGGGTVTVNGTVVVSGQNSQAIDLVAGVPKTITIVTTESGKSPKTYVIVVTRSADSNAMLSGLSVSAGTLSPGFKSSVNEYTVSVPYTTTTIKVTPTVAAGTSTIKVNNQSAASGSETGELSLSVGQNTVAVEVTSQSGFKQSYVILVTRQPASQDSTLSSLTISDGTLTPPFSAYTKDYTLSVPYSRSELVINATASSPFATLTGDGLHALAVGENNLKVVVTAQNGTTVSEYKIVVTREGNSAVSTIEGVTSWTDARSDNQAVAWHEGRDYMFEKVFYAELPDTSVSLSSNLIFDETVTYASLRKEYSDDLIAGYDGDASRSMAVDFGTLEEGDNVFILEITREYDEESNETDEYTIDIKVGESRQALAMVYAYLDSGQESATLPVSHNGTYDYTMILPAPNASFRVYLTPENVTSELEAEGYGIEMGMFFAGANSLQYGWNEIVVKMKDIAGNPAAQDTIINVWRPSEESESGPDSLKLSLSEMAFENDGQSFYAESQGGFGFYSVTAHGTNADISFTPLLVDPQSELLGIYVVNNEDGQTELPSNGEGQYSFGLELGDNVEIVVKDSEGHRFRHRIHISHTLTEPESLLPTGIEAWSVQGFEVKKDQYIRDDYYNFSLSETYESPQMNLVFDPEIYSGAALYSGTGFGATSQDPVASWGESEETAQTINGIVSGYNDYTLELYPAGEEEGSVSYTVTIGNGSASIYGMSLLKTYNGGDFPVEAGWTNTGSEAVPVYQAYLYSSFSYLRLDMQFDSSLVSDATLEEIDADSPIELRKYKEGGYYLFDAYQVPDGLRHLKLSVTETDGVTKHEYDLYVHFDPQDNGVASVISNVAGWPVSWTRVEGTEEETSEGYVQRQYAVLPAGDINPTLDWSMTLVSNYWLEEYYEVEEASIDGQSSAVQVNESGMQAQGQLALTPGYHDIRIKYKKLSPMSEESATHYIREWIVFVGAPSQMSYAPEAGLDGERVTLTQDESHGLEPIPLDGEGLSYWADVDYNVEGVILQVAAYSPYSRVDVEFMQERPNELSEGRYYLSSLSEGDNEVSIKVTDPTGTVEQTYTLIIYKAEFGGGEEPSAPPAQLSGLRIGSEMVSVDQGQYDYTVYLPYGAPESMVVHAVAADQDHMSLTVNGEPWLWDDDNEAHALAPNEAGEYELEVSSGDGSYTTSVYHIHVERLLTEAAKINGDVPVSWTSAGSDVWNSGALEMEDGDWLSMNFGKPDGYHLFFETDGSEFDAEQQRWYPDSGVNKLTVEVKWDGKDTAAATYQFVVYNWNSVVVTNMTAGTNPDRMRAIKWKNTYYATLPSNWFASSESPQVKISTLEGQEVSNLVGWDFTNSIYEGTLTHNDSANHSVTRAVGVFAPVGMPLFQARFQGGSFEWTTESIARFFYGNDERPGAYFWSNDNTMIPTGVELRVSQLSGNIQIYAMDDDDQPLARTGVNEDWHWSLPLSWLESDGDVQTYKVVVQQSGRTAVYLLSFGAGSSPTA